jgi:G3E family GTPase
MAQTGARARKPPIPITLVVGPRGAGKTTLINRLLATPEFASTAVIVNDFGAVAVHGSVVNTVADGYISLGSGCVCCEVRGALADSLENLLRDLDNGRVAAIGRLVIEADEMADPAAILGAVLRHPYLSLRFVPDGIVAAWMARRRSRRGRRRYGRSRWRTSWWCAAIPPKRRAPIRECGTQAPSRRPMS